MSTITRVLVHVNDSLRSRDVLRRAVALAAAHGASVQAVHAVEPTPVAAYAPLEAPALVSQFGAENDASRLEQARALVEEVAAATRTPIAFSGSFDGDALGAMLRAAWTSDLMVVGQRNPADPGGTAAGFPSRLIVQSSCPVLFVPYVDTLPEAPAGQARRVLVAWADRRESARALRDALPLLRHAEGVELVRFDREGDDAGDRMTPVLDFLKGHGIEATATVRRTREPTFAERMAGAGTADAPVAEALQSHAADGDADLIVMGGWGHTRAWELVLGGVTRTMLQSMTVPVLMSH